MSTRSRNQRRAREREICHETYRRLPGRLPWSVFSLLVLVLVTIAPGASKASVYDLTAGWDYTCAIADDDAVCWGGPNQYGQATVPAGLTNASAIAAGDYHTCAIDDNGVTCWGRND